MNLVHPDESLVPILKRIATGGLKYRVYYSPYTPTKATLLSDLIVLGISDPVTVVVGDFSTSGVAGNKGTIIAAPVAIAIHGSQQETVYGYYITDSTSTELLGAAEFDTPVLVPAGDTTNVTPILGDSSRFG